MRFTSMRTGLLLLMAALLGASSADAAVDPDAAVVHLRKDCAGYDNCVTKTSHLHLHTRMQSDRVVKVGPGLFTGSLFCDRSSRISFEGSGREVTTIDASGGGLANGGLLGFNCEDASFSDMRVVGGVYGIIWFDSGSSSWTNIDVVTSGIGRRYGWYEDSGGCTPTTMAIHYFYNSTFEVTLTGFDPAKDQNPRGTPFLAICDENWFFGGALVLRLDPGTDGTVDGAAAEVSFQGSLRAIGTRIEVHSEGSSAAFYNAAGLTGIQIGRSGDEQPSQQGGGVFHSHGSEVLVDASTSPGADAVAIWFEQESGAAPFAHTPGTAFDVRVSPTGTATRLAPPTFKPMSPNLWPPGASPPAVDTLDGYDLFVETDCNSSTGCDDPATGEAHLMISNPTECSSGWLDLATKACRP